MSKVSLDLSNLITEPGVAGIYIPIVFSSATLEWTVNFVTALQRRGGVNNPFIEVKELSHYQGVEYCLHVSYNFTQDDFAQIEEVIETAHKLADEAERKANEALVRIRGLTTKLAYKGK